MSMSTEIKNMKPLNESDLKKTSDRFRVNEVAEFLGITPRILKHYETTGVLCPERTENNDYRSYTAEDVIKIQAAEQLKAIGLTSREISGYFSGELDIGKTFDKLTALRDKINNLLEILALDMNPDQPRFSIVEESTKLCYVKTYPLCADLLQRYYDARETYCLALRSGCRCDCNDIFFLLFSDKETYRICVPVLSAPKKSTENETIQEITRKKSFVVKTSGMANDIFCLRVLLSQEAERRGLKLSGIVWTQSQTGPNRKTPQRLYTLTAGAEIL